MRIRLVLQPNSPGGSPFVAFPEVEVPDQPDARIVRSAAEEYLEKELAVTEARKLDERISRLFGWRYELLKMVGPDQEDHGFLVWRVDRSDPEAVAAYQRRDMESLQPRRQYVGFVAASPPEAGA